MLLPVCWARRIARLLRGSDLRRYARMLDYGDVTETDLDEMRRFLAAGGCGPM